MSLQSKLKKAKRQGYIRTFELVFTRFVPPWIFRYSKGDIYDLDIEKLAALNVQSGHDVGGGLVAKCLVDAEDPSNAPNDIQRSRLRSFTWNSVPLESTKNDFGYAIYDPKDPEKFLGGVWVGVESFGEDNLGLEFQLGNRQAWLYCAFVDGDARGRGVYKKLLSFVAQDVRSRGFSQLLTVINPWNIVSRGAHEKQSKRICGTVSSVRFFSLARVWSSGNVHIDKRWVTQIKDRPSIITMK